MLDLQSAEPRLLQSVTSGSFASSPSASPPRSARRRPTRKKRRLSTGRARQPITTAIRGLAGLFAESCRRRSTNSGGVGAEPLLVRDAPPATSCRRRWPASSSTEARGAHVRIPDPRRVGPWVRAHDDRASTAVGRRGGSHRSPRAGTRRVGRRALDADRHRADVGGPLGSSASNNATGARLGGRKRKRSSRGGRPGRDSRPTGQPLRAGLAGQAEWRPPLTRCLMASSSSTRTAPEAANERPRRRGPILLNLLARIVAPRSRTRTAIVAWLRA